MIFETIEELNPETKAKRVLVYEDDGITLIMFSKKYYEGDEELELMKIFDSDDLEYNDGPQDD